MASLKTAPKRRARFTSARSTIIQAILKADNNLTAEGVFQAVQGVWAVEHRTLAVILSNLKRFKFLKAKTVRCEHCQTSRLNYSVTALGRDMYG